MSKDMIINATAHETRVAVLEEGLLTEVLIERTRQRGVVGNVYKGRVTKVLPGMQSAFVDIGLEKDAFLYVSDVTEDFEDYESFLGADAEPGLVVTANGELDENIPEERLARNVSIDDLLKEGQEILVQVSKETIASKGARITTHITLPGRYLVFMPTVRHIGVSRRIEGEEERARLKDILKSLSQNDPYGGFIVRTAGEGLGEEEFAIDRRYLVNLSESIRKRAEHASAPSILHRDLDLVLRVLRDTFSADFATLWIDSVEEYRRIVEFLDQVQPKLIPKVKLYRKNFPIFEEFGFEAEIEKALKSKVWLKSGGYIVINQTEALVAIDINTGKYVGKRRLEDTVFRTNIEAVKEIVRQIRLRDLGGILVIDFIDMEEEANKTALIEALELELRKDRSKTKLAKISDFGLVEITRKRVRQSLERQLTQACPYCTGSGRIKSNATISLEIRREILKMAESLDGQEILVRVHPEIFAVLKNDQQGVLKEIEEQLGVKVLVKVDAGLHHERFDVVKA